MNRHAHFCPAPTHQPCSRLAARPLACSELIDGSVLLGCSPPSPAKFIELGVETTTKPTVKPKKPRNRMAGNHYVSLFEVTLNEQHMNSVLLYHRTRSEEPGRLTLRKGIWAKRCQATGVEKPVLAKCARATRAAFKGLAGKGKIKKR